MNAQQMSHKKILGIQKRKFRQRKNQTKEKKRLNDDETTAQELLELSVQLNEKLTLFDESSSFGQLYDFNICQEFQDNEEVFDQDFSVLQNNYSEITFNPQQYNFTSQPEQKNDVEYTMFTVSYEEQ